MRFLLVAFFVVANVITTMAQLPVASSAAWEKYLRIYHTAQPPASIAATETVFEPGTTQFYCYSYNKSDSILVAVTEANSGSGGPQISIIAFGANKLHRLLLNTYGFINKVKVEKDHIVIEKYTRGYNWGQLLWRIKATRQRAVESAVARAGVPIEILTSLPNIKRSCSKSFFDCSELYGTTCDTLYQQQGQYLLFVYNKSKAPWFFTTQAQQKRNIEVLGFLYIKNKGTIKLAGTIWNTDSLYQTTTIYNKWPVLAAKGRVEQGDLYYVFDNIGYKTAGNMPMQENSEMRKIIYCNE